MARPDIHIKFAASAWRVHEQLEFSFAGHGEHAYFFVEKQNLNSLDVARQLAEACAVGLEQIGYAGLKDKHAVTRQWFSVPYPRDEWPLPENPEQSAQTETAAYLRCLQIQRHTHKLRRGQHRSNRFVLRLGCSTGVNGTVVRALDDWFPNYFGPQRVSPANVATAQQWLAQGRGKDAPRGPRGSKRRRAQRGGRRGWHLSVLRSVLFNAVLDQRVAQANFAQAISGDVLQDGVPTGPLWGRGRSAASALASDIEQQALQPHQAVCDALEFTGLQQARRPLAQRPSGLCVNPVTDKCAGAAATDLTELEVAFELPPGAYATTLLAHYFTVHDDSKPS